MDCAGSVKNRSPFLTKQRAFKTLKHEKAGPITESSFRFFDNGIILLPLFDG